MRPEDEQRLLTRYREDITSNAGNYCARVLLAKNREKELEKIREELGENTDMSGISNAIWARMQEMLESTPPKK